MAYDAERVVGAGIRGRKNLENGKNGRRTGEKNPPEGGNKPLAVSTEEEMTRNRIFRWRWAIALMVFTLFAAACGDDDAPAATAPPEIVTVTSIVTVEVPGETVTIEVPGETVIVEVPVTAAPMGPLTGAERCAANEAAGEITFLTGFGFFPAISIAVILAAEDQGFFDDMCLDVNIQPSVPGESIVLISANVIQFSTNQIGELSQAQTQGAQSQIVLNWGHSPVHVLLVEDDSPILTPADFAGATIGSVGGTLNAGLQGLLLSGGLRINEDYEVAARSFNPFEITGFDAIAAFRSNEPDSLNNGGVPVRIFRPEDFGAVGTFAAIQVSNEFARLHPTAVEDWVRAVVMATDWAIDNPEATVAIAESLTEGNFAFDHELFRFNEEVKLSLESTPEGHNFGRIHPATVAQEISSMRSFGILEGGLDLTALYTNAYVDAVYDDNGAIIWPGPIGE